MANPTLRIATRRARHAAVLSRGLPFSIILLAGLLSGCNAFYLHNPEREALTEKAKQQLTGVDLISLTNQQTTILADYAKREEAAVIEYGIQARDQRLLSMFRPDLADPDSVDDYTATNGSLQVKRQHVYDELTRSTNDRLAALICGDGPVALPGPAAAAVPPHASCTYQIADVLAYSAPTNPKASADVGELAILERARAGYVAALKLADRAAEAGNVKRCAALPQEEVSDWKARHPDRTLGSLGDLPEGVDRAEAEYYLTCEVQQMLVSEDLRQSAQVLQGGELSQTLDELSAGRNEIASLKAQEAELAAAAQELDNSIKEANEGGIEQAVAAVEGKLAEVKDAAKGVGLEKLADILDSLIRSDLGAAADKAAGTGSGEPDAAKLAALNAVSRLLKTTAAAAETFDGKNPIERLNSLLILRAGLQQKIDETRIYRNLVESRLLVSEAEVRAMESEIYQLARVKSTLDNVSGTSLAGDETLLQALAAYTSSWNRGRIPQYLASFKKAQAERTYAVKLYQATAKNYRALLEPAFVALEAYAKGGITPSDLAKVFAVTLFLAKFATL